MFEHNNGIIKCRKTKKNRQYNSQTEMDKRTNNALKTLKINQHETQPHSNEKRKQAKMNAHKHHSA